MSAHILRKVAWFLVGAYIILAAVGMVLQGVTHKYFAGFDFTVIVLMYGIFSLWPIIGGLIVSRHPHNPIGWIWCLGMLFVVLDPFAFGYASYSLTAASTPLPFTGLALLWLNWSGMPFGILMLTLVTILFPTGRPISPRWGRLVWLAAGALIVYLLLKALEPGPYFFYPALDNPFAVNALIWTWLYPVMLLALVILSTCLLAGGFSLILRLRRARGDERQQVKWLFLPLGLFVIGIPIVALSENDPTGLLMLLGGGMHMLAVSGMVAATAFAIFKYRLYDIDLIINRTLVYSALTGSLALVYFLSVVLLQQIFSENSQFSIVLSTLATAALFAPLRRRIQETIDKRFYRRRYDAERIIAAFAVQMRDQVELDKLSAALLATVEETMQPEHFSLWLR